MARKPKRKIPGCSTLVMLMAVFLAIMTVCGFMVMVWGILLLEQDDAQNATCHLSLAVFSSVSATATTAPPSSEPIAVLTQVWNMTPGDQWVLRAAPQN